MRLVAEEASENENAPSHRVFAAKTEIGACWQKSFKEGRYYLSMTLDDPSFTAPIFLTKPHMKPISASIDAGTKYGESSCCNR